MKKCTVLLLSFMLFISLGFSQSDYLMDLDPDTRAALEATEVEPLTFQKSYVEQTPTPYAVNFPVAHIEAPFDLQLNFNLEIITGALGNAGAEFDGTGLYSTRWASNLIHELDLTGTLVREFSIAGATGLRDLAYDGTFMYGGAAGNTIFVMDFATNTLIGTITSPVLVRFIAYDEAADGFWVGNWSDPPTLIDRSGTTLGTITTGFLGQYGAAYDSYSAGGPYLWVFDQGAGAGQPQFIHQFDIASGTATGFSYDVLTDLGPNAQAIAGGLWVSEGVVAGKASIGGVMQGTPDVHFAYELADAGDPSDPLPPTSFSAYSDYTMPTSMDLNWTDPTNYVNGNPLTNFQVLIYQDSVLIDSVGMGVETFTAAGLTDGQAYLFEVAAKDSVDSLSAPAAASWTAGGAVTPNPPTAFALSSAGGGDLEAFWTNPTNNVDGTPMDDFDAINIYEGGTLLTTFTRTSADTGRADSAVFTPVGVNQEYYVTAVDNETPANESAGSNSAFPPFAAPYVQDFETGIVGTPGTLPIQWTNETGDDFDWYVDAGGTPSTATGPTVDHTLGTAAGIYVYTETSGPAVGAIAHLTSPFIDVSTVTAPVLAFWYHMHGATMGELHVDAFFQGAWVLDIMTPLVGQQQAAQTDPWLIQIVDLTPYTSQPIQLRFRGIRGTSFTGDMAIDDVIISSLQNDPQMVVAPTTIDTTLLVGDSISHDITISNNQPLPSLLNYTVTVDPTAPWLSVDTDSGQVGSLGSDVITVGISAIGLTAGNYSGTVTVAGNDPANPTEVITVNLQANQAPVISIAPDTFDVTLTSGQTATDTMTITNSGNGPLDWEIAAGEVPELIWYKFDEAGGSTTQNFAASGTAVGFPNAPVLGGLTMGGTGQTGAALIGAGGSSSTDYVDTGWITDLGANSWTIEVWFNNVPNNTTLYYLFGDNTATSFRAFIGGVAGAGNIILRGPVTDIIVSGISPGPSVVRFVYDSTVPEIRGYLNGVLNNTVAQSGVNIQGTANFKVGGYATSAGMPAGMLMDDFKIFNQALDPGAENRLVDWLTFNPTSGMIPPMSSADVLLHFDPTGLLGGDYTTKIFIASNDPQNPEVEAGAHMLVIGQAVISTPDTLEMDITFTSGTSTQDLAVNNAGSDTLRITNIVSTNSVFTVDTTNFVVEPPSGSFTVTVSFSPLLPGTEDGYLIISSNDPITPFDTVYVFGVAVEAPVLGLSPNFTNPVIVNMDDSTDIFVTLSNTGGSNLLWSAATSNAPVTEGQLIFPKFGPSQSLASADASPVQTLPGSHAFIEAPWDLQFSFDATLASGAAGNAGAEFDGTNYYTTRWASNLIHQYDLAGTMTLEFSIAGVTGLRDLAYDGALFYGGAAANTVFVMDFATQTLLETITSPVGVRNISYDDGADGFWVGNWADPPTLIDRSGSTIATLTTGLAGQYGAAYDGWSDGGPYLWVFDQGTGAGFPQLVHQFDLNTLTATGFTYDVASDFPAAAGIAGGLWTGEGVVSGKVSIGGLLQGTPDNFFVYELTDAGAAWLQLVGLTSGSIAPMDNFDVQLRVFGTTDPEDSAYVVIQSNDPVLPVVNELVIRQVVVGLEDLEILPTTFDVAQNYPNPFNPTTTINYQVPQVSDVNLVVYNILGQKVRTLVNDRMEPGYHSVVWDGRNEDGRTVASGIYIYRFEASDFTKTLKLMLLK